MTRRVTKATPIQFIDSNKLKSCRIGLANHTRPISHNITPLVMNGLGSGHTDRQTDRQTDTDTDTQTHRHTHTRPVARGGSVGSDEPPSQTKGPLFYAKRSTFYNKRSNFYNKGPLFQ